MKRLSLLIAVVFFIGMLSGCSGSPKPAEEEPDIMQIRSICNLATLECYYHNVAKSVKEGTGILEWFKKDRKLWIEYTGSAKIGIDMYKVSMKIEGENITISMPNAKLLSIDIEELTQDSYIISEDGWLIKNKITAEEQAAAINDAQAAMKKSVESNFALLLNAQNRAKDLIENYINKMGELSCVSYTIQWEYEDAPTECESQSDGSTAQSE